MRVQTAEHSGFTISASLKQGSDVGYERVNKISFEAKKKKKKRGFVSTELIKKRKAKEIESIKKISGFISAKLHQ